MSYIINLEVKFFLMSVLWGIILLVIYDCLRIFRKVIDHNVVWISIEDVLYWMISAVLIFRMMYQQNDGIIRGFSMIGILLGMILYKYSISDAVVKGISFVLNKIKKLIKKIIHMLIKPLKFVGNKVKGIQKKCNRFIKSRIVLLSHFVQINGRKLSKALKSKIKRGKMDESSSTNERENSRKKRRYSKKYDKDTA